MKLSLYQRLSFALLTVFIAIAAMFYLWWHHLEQKTRFESEQKLHLSLAANLARDNPLLQQGVYDYEALKNLFHTLMVMGPAFEFYYLDPEGKILTYSADKDLVKRERVELKPVIDLIKNRASLPIYGDDPRHHQRQKIFSAAPVFNGAELQGYLYVIVTGERYDHILDGVRGDNRFEMSIVIVCAAIMFLFFVMIWLFRYITQPLRRLSRDMQAFKQSGFNPETIALSEWQCNSDNEVSQLGCVFKEMAAQINLQLVQLTQVDNKRRELLADISHDLRTPLASLQGYVEMMALKDEKLSTEQRHDYLVTVLKNTEQLKSLIDQLFELAHLEGGQVSLNMEAFNLAELIYDVMAKFSLQAQKKQINLTVTPEFSDIQAYSDISKIERVLSNLIENAIRHTAEGGVVNISLQENNDGQCQVMVSDNGTGIHADEISYIFDARYRASNATEGKHTGLGLAITKKLLELLSTEIHVNSVLGKGSDFAFRLRTAAKH